MNKLNKNYEEYQQIEITNQSIIDDFLNVHIPVWEEDILQFHNFKPILTKENISKIYFYSYIGLTEELEYQFVFKNNETKSFYLEKDTIYKWLDKHNLID